MRAVGRGHLDVLAAAGGLDADRLDLLEPRPRLKMRGIAGQERRLIDVVGGAGLGVLEQAVGDVDQLDGARQQNAIFEPAVK